MSNFGAIQLLIRKDIAGKNLFEPTTNFTLKQMSFIYLTKYFESEITNTVIVIKKGENLKDKDYSALGYNLLVRLPRIEDEVERQIRHLLDGLRTNQDNHVQDGKVLELKCDIMSFCKDIGKFRKVLKYRRYSGFLRIGKWPPDLYCKRFFMKEDKATKSALDKIPLTNPFPSSESKCSWDMLDDTIGNLVIPNERINLLVNKLKKSKLFGYKTTYLYSEKSKLIWDVCALLVCSVLTVIFDRGIDYSIKNTFSSICWLGRNLSAAAVFILIGKIVLRDVRYWSENFNDIVKYIRK